MENTEITQDQGMTTREMSLLLHKILAFTGTLSLNKFRENWDVMVTIEFHRF